MMDKLKLKLNNTVVEITHDDNGRYSLNDLFKASAYDDSKKPTKFLRNAHSNVVIVDLNKRDKLVPFPEDFDSYVVLSGKGRGSKTFAPLKIVYKYAAFISKDFENAVYDAFTALTKGDTQEAANIASSVTLTPEIIALYDKTHVKLNNLLKSTYPDNKHIYTNTYRLLSKVVSGYTPNELTGGFNSTVDFIKEQNHLPAMNGYIAAMQIMLTLIAAGVTDYHVIAAALQVKTTKNGSILKVLD